MARQITLPDDLINAIDAYPTTDWSKRDPSKIGALNAVAYIGERVASIVGTRADHAKRKAARR